MLAANAHLAPGYAGGLAGIARSMPTSARRRPRRREARHRHATRRRPAGSSSATCSTPAWPRSAARRAPAPAPNHVREKDGLWAVLLWLNILAVRKESVKDDRRASTGPNYGRNYYSRHDYEEIDTAAANGADGRPARQARHAARHQASAASTVAAADDFAYHDPVDGSVSQQPGHPHPVRGRLARRLPPVRHRHRRRDAARLYRALRARPDAPRPGHAGGARRPDRAPPSEVAGIRERTGRAEPNVIT